MLFYGSPQITQLANTAFPFRHQYQSPSTSFPYLLKYILLVRVSTNRLSKFERELSARLMDFQMDTQHNSAMTFN
uniref:Uncharacterized protein n=1 Tax=Arundo donax TaxID=35708 RepID=A0A0A9H3Q0_ARUDO